MLTYINCMVLFRKINEKDGKREVIKTR